MIPGFVNIYKDENEFIHLYFFSGLDNNNETIYKDIDLTDVPFTYTMNKNVSSIDYKFDNKSIVRIKCQLVNRKTGKIEKKTLTI